MLAFAPRKDLLILVLVRIQHRKDELRIEGATMKIGKVRLEGALIAGVSTLVAFWVIVKSSGAGLLSEGEPTAWLLPCIAAAGMATTGLLNLACVFKGESENIEGLITHPRRFAWYVGSLCAFALFLESAGFVTLVVFLLPPLLRFGEGLSWRTTVLVTIASAAAIVFIFQFALGIDLPKGQFLSELL